MLNFFKSYPWFVCLIGCWGLFIIPSEGGPLNEGARFDPVLSRVFVEADHVPRRIVANMYAHPYSDDCIYHLQAGVGDDDNSLFFIQGDQLRLGRSLGERSGQVLKVRLRISTPKGETWDLERMIRVVADEDGNGLDDEWERMMGFESDSQDPLSDVDGDGLNFVEEQFRGTDPFDSDWDDDGLPDGVETLTGVYQGATDTGSSPFHRDSDGDGATDYEEVLAGVDPNNATILPARELPLRINEFLASNGGGLRDSDGDSPDWIELFNPGDSPISLEGYALTDDPLEPAKWLFPNIQLPAGGYWVVFASGKDYSSSLHKDPGGFFHLPFRLNANGDYLALTSAGGNQVLQEWKPTYPAQRVNVSYGISSEDGNWVFFETPTPGKANGRGVPGWLDLPRIAPSRGFYHAPIQVSIQSNSPESEIYFTLNGDEPNPSTGRLYTGPFEIGGTTVIRAAAFQSGYLDSFIASGSFLFASDIVEQPSLPSGYPSDWGTDNEVPGRVAADYEMDPRVVRTALPGYSVEEALQDIPTLSISMPVEDFLGSQTGIYNHPKSRGAAWEKACSIEWIEPDDSGFQVNAIIEIHGNSSRRPWRMQKHSFRLTFRASQGTARLDYPLFDGSDVTTFNQLVLRGCFTDSWGLVSWDPGRYRPNDSQYIRDVWMKESLRDMGHPSSRGNFAHLYINGLYWGLYNVTERLNESFFSEHFGGRESDWQIIEDFGGSSSGWARMFNIARNQLDSPEGWAELEEVLDVDNFIDYMLLHFYGDAEDWPHHNGYAAHNPAIGFPFRFFVWDQEIVLDNHGIRPYSRSETGKPGELFQLLRRHETFRRRFMDRSYRHLNAGGALSLQSSRERYVRIASQIDKAIVAESARWGDTQRKTPYGNRIDLPSNPENPFDRNYPMPPNGPDFFFTREDSWLKEKEAVLDAHLPAIYEMDRSNSLVRELISERLYSSVPPPVLNIHGTFVAEGQTLELTASSGVIYYTLDGSDPWDLKTSTVDSTVLIPERIPARAWIPEDDRYNRLWRALFFDDRSWLEGQTGIGYDSAGGDYLPWIGLDAGAMRGLNTSVYLRIPFQIDVTDGLSQFNGLRLSVRFDDGFVAWLNGSLVASENAPVQVDHQSMATASHADDQALIPQSFDLSRHLGLLQPGPNILAVQCLNVSLTSSDLLFMPTLEAVKFPSTGPSNSSVRVYEGPLVIQSTSHLKARVLSGGEWSPLLERKLTVAEPAEASNLVIAEIHYHPMGIPEAEFLELWNPSDKTLILEGVRLTGGVEFLFDSSHVIEANQRVVLVRDLPSFTRMYGDKARIMGAYAGALDNAGETLAVHFANGEETALTYDDKRPWPERADGLGHSLVIRYPSPNLDWNQAVHWDISSELGGSPGEAGRVRHESHPNEDIDRDGLHALLEYFIGLSDSNKDPQNDADWFRVENDGLEALDLKIRHHPGSWNVVWEIESSADLLHWNPLPIKQEELSYGDSTPTKREITIPLRKREASGGLPAVFYRLKLDAAQLNFR